MDVKNINPFLQSSISIVESVTQMKLAVGKPEKTDFYIKDGTGKEYRGAMRFAPFISLGIGLTGVKNENRTVDYSSMTHEEANNKIVTANIPLGFGVKYRYKDRINFAVQWQMHFTLSDQMDGLKDTYRIKSSGLFKNTDCYSTLMFSLTYSISPKCPTCMKDR